MNHVIGRSNEIRVLNDALLSKSSELVAITGRRRIGKTYLINTALGSEMCFSFTGLQNQPQEVQLQAFATTLSKYSKRKTIVLNNWLDAFNALQQYLTSIKSKKKKIIFIDELPWMDTPKSGFIQKFAYFWNNWAAWQHNIVLIIAGSSTSWIINKIYNDKGGLHNRVTKRIFIEPFTLAQTQAFFTAKKISLSQYDITLLYMAMGGVPFYLDQVKKGESATQCINRLFFKPGALLASEFNNLFHAIFTKADAHISVIKALAKHRYGLNRTALLQSAKVSNSGGGSKVLDELVTTGYVVYQVPFGKKNNSGKYILADFYSMFYLRFVAGNTKRDWLQYSKTQSYKVWCGLSFEWLCHLHSNCILKALGISGIYNNVSYLSILDDSKKATAQIDMLITRADNAFNLVEIKFAQDQYIFTAAEAESMRNKVSQLQRKIKVRQSVYVTIVTPFGCVRNMHYLSIADNEVQLRDLFIET